MPDILHSTAVCRSDPVKDYSLQLLPVKVKQTVRDRKSETETKLEHPVNFLNVTFCGVTRTDISKKRQSKQVDPSNPSAAAQNTCNKWNSGDLEPVL